jgi:hypothetical protein
VAAFSTGNGTTFAVVGGVILVAFIIVWRIVVHDRAIRRIRFGFFYERERECDEEDPARDERLARKEERP